MPHPLIELYDVYIIYGKSLKEENSLHRTQVYLTETAHETLRRLSGRTGCSQSELIRAAVDHYIAVLQAHDREAILREAAGLWSDVTDRPDFSALRAEMDRHQMGEHY